MKQFIYTGDRTKEISFPLGGIGSGCIGLSGTGRLIDWEIFNRPNKGSLNGFSHFGIKAEQAGNEPESRAVLDARILNSDIHPPYTGEYSGSHFNSFGFGTHRYTMAGVPHFRDLEFQGNFPTAELHFKDNTFPGNVKMEAFNPFIPLDDKNSSIPAAFFRIKVCNTTNEELFYTVEGSLAVPTANGEWENNLSLKETDIYCMTTKNKSSDEDDPEFGDLTIAVVHGEGETSHQEYWYRGNWFDGLQMFWRDFTTTGPFKNRHYPGPNKSRFPDTATLATTKKIGPGEEKEFHFIISWNFPNCYNYWSESCQCDGDDCCSNDTRPKIWKNYYTTLFTDSTASAYYGLSHWDNLYNRTKEFQQILYSSSLPEAALDALGANLSTLKSPTCLRLTDGSFYGFEGCHCDSGCCEGSCTHVWNYAYALPYLFPRLERSMRDLDFTYNQRDDGRMSFRLQLPLGTSRQEFRACIDGQMGGVIKSYREWKISGDDEWLRHSWPAIKKSIEFTWSTSNEDQWDPQKSGIITGRQHHTLDMELFGPNSWLNSFYLAALKAGAVMARYLGEEKTAQEYEKIFTKGKQWTEEHLFNGEYFHQKIDLKQKDLLSQFEKGNKSLHGETVHEAYWDDEHEEIKYQIGEGCIIDQVLGQWHANLIGLGEILDREKVKSALKAIYKYNFKPSVRNHFNPCRLYCLNDEAGTVICEWPDKVEKPHIPIPYSEETMHGFEYQAAIHMIQEGMIDEGIQMVQAVRSRYDGSKRNPWNEFECGSNYARSMAGYALLLTFSGFQADMTEKRIRFHPIKLSEHSSADSRETPSHNGPHVLRYFWSVEGAWGDITIKEESVQLTVREGSLSLKELVLPYFKGKKLASADVDQKTELAEMNKETVLFEPEIDIAAGETLRVVFAG